MVNLDKVQFLDLMKGAIKIWIENRFGDELYDHMLSKDRNNFCGIWSAETCKNIVSVGSIDGKTDDTDIATLLMSFLTSLI